MFTIWIFAIIAVLVFQLIVSLHLYQKSSKQHDRVLPPRFYYECELEAGSWAHNDAIATIGIREDLSEDEINCPNEDGAWAVERVEKNELQYSLGDGVEMTIVTKNGRRWIYEMYIPDRWDWLIQLPLIRFLNDPKYRERIESKVNDEDCNSNIELLIACCLLHAPEYHTSVQEEGKTQEQLDTDQAEKLLLSSAKKGNLNATYELICLYHAKKEYEKVVELNDVIQSETGRGVWFVDRFEKSLYHIKKH